jgi:photosystem II stability/assembly factor-like uncharacterized protein
VANHLQDPLSVYFADATRGWAIYGGRDVVDVWATRDAGRSWHRNWRLPPTALQPDAIAVRGNHVSIDTTGAVQAAFLSSRDGGRSWQEALLPSALGTCGGALPNSIPPCLGLSSHGHEWLLTGTALWTTTNGGRTWTQLDG